MASGSLGEIADMSDQEKRAGLKNILELEKEVSDFAADHPDDDRIPGIRNGLQRIKKALQK